MLHIKDIEAFARINEALAAAATDVERRPSSDPGGEPAAIDLGRIGGIGYDFDFLACPPDRHRPARMAGVLARVFLGRR